MSSQALAVKKKVNVPAKKAQKTTEVLDNSELHKMLSQGPHKRHKMISQEAYLRAEQRGFVGGDPVQDWLEAEKDVDNILNLIL